MAQGGFLGRLSDMILLEHRCPADVDRRLMTIGAVPDRLPLLLQVLEQIMFRYVDLCVELKKGRYAKDGLIHYRNVCQQVNVSSLEEVIKYFLKTATNKAEAAQSKAAEVKTLLNRSYVEQLSSCERPRSKLASMHPHH